MLSKTKSPAIGGQAASGGTNKLKKFEIWSAVGTIVFGSLLHFAFEWSGSWKPLALFAAVNESTWEHLKLAFWPALIFAAIAYLTFAKSERNFCFAQMKKLFAMPILIVVLFYGWLAFFPDNFIYDISIFAVAVILGHILAYKLETKQWFPRISSSPFVNSLSLFGIMVLLLAFSLLSYFPPKAGLWHDPVSGGYGISK